MPAFRLFVPDGESTDPLVPEIVELYLSYLQARVDAGSFSADAFDNVQRELRRFGRVYCVPIGACRRTDLIDWVSQNPQWKSAHTKKRVCAAIITCFRWACEEKELIAKCPYKRPREIFDLEYVPRKPAKNAEYLAIFRKANRSIRRALFALYQTGMRTCEMRTMRREEVHLDADPPHIFQPTSKSGKPRKIVLDALTARFFAWMLRTTTTDLLFTNAHGGQWTRKSFALRVRITAKRAGINQGVAKVSAYCLRHKYACDGIRAGLSNKAVADLLGHTTTAMVDRVYAVSTREDLDHLAKSADEIAKRRKA